MQTGISLTTLDAGIHAHINAHNTHMCTYTHVHTHLHTYMYQHHTQKHTCLFVCATHMTHQHACTHLSAHTCVHIPYTRMHTLVHIYVHTQPHAAQVLKGPHEQALSLPFLCGLSSHKICLWSCRRRDQGADQTLFFAQQWVGGRGGSAGGHRTHVPTAHRGQHEPPSGDGHRAHVPTAQKGWQGPPSGSFSGLGAPGLLQHSGSCQTSTLLEIQNTQPLLPEDWCGATGPDCRASGEPGLPH